MASHLEAPFLFVFVRCRDFPWEIRENPLWDSEETTTFAAEIRKQNVESYKDYDYEEDVVYPGYHADNSSIG